MECRCCSKPLRPKEACGFLSQGQGHAEEHDPYMLLVSAVTGPLEHIVTLSLCLTPFLNKTHLYLGAIPREAQTPFAEERWLFLGSEKGKAEDGNSTARIFAEPLCIMFVLRAGRDL